MFVMKKIALIGPMGCGKSTVALQYGKAHNKKVIDLDKEFTDRYGEISRFMRNNGEDEFRAKESELVLRAVNSDADIISCGGGVVLRKRNINALRQHCDIVCLTAPVDILKARISGSDRPLAPDIERIVKERERLYKLCADHTIDTSCGDGAQKLEEVLKEPRKNRYDVLLCDADDTVLNFQRAMQYSITKAARAVGIKADEQTVIDEFRAASRIVWRRLEDEGLLRNELDRLRFTMLKERLSEDFDVAVISSAFMSELKKTRYVLDGALEFLASVRARGIKVYIVTNGFAPIAHERLKALSGYIDGSFISDEIGYNKPDRRLFDHVFSVLGDTDRSRALVFGDSVNSDIRGGIESGIDTCLYDPTGAVKSDADYSVRDYGQLLNIL